MKTKKTFLKPQSILMMLIICVASYVSAKALTTDGKTTEVNSQAAKTATASESDSFSKSRKAAKNNIELQTPSKSDTLSGKGNAVKENIEKTDVPFRTKEAAYRAAVLTRSMDCEVGLREKQFAEIEAINLKACKQMDEARKKYAGNDGKLIAAGIKIDKERNIDLRDALTPRQWSVYEPISKGNKAALKATESCRKELANGIY